MPQHIAPQTYEIPAGATRNVAVDCRGQLDTNEVITGTPTVEVSPEGPTIDNVKVSTAALTILGASVPAGEAVQFRVSGLTAGTRYQFTITASTNSSPAQTLIGGCVARGVAN
jgi:hypothetical protein